MNAADARPVARLTDPAEMVQLVPHLCGYVPSESLVVISLRGPRKRVGLTMRMDLRACDEEQAAADEVAARIAHDGGRAVLLVVYTEQPDSPERVRASLVESVTAALAARRIAVQDALLVRSGRWWSYRCSDARCCPPEGVRVEAMASSPALALVEATQAFEGRAVLADRADLVAALQPPTFLAAEAAGPALDRALDTLLDDAELRGFDVVRRGSVDAWRKAVDRSTDPRTVLPDAEAMALTVSLTDVRVRDEVMTWAVDAPEPLLRLLLDLAGRIVAPYDVPVCTLLAIVAWSHGNGGLANIALDRAWVGDREYSLAALVRDGLHQQVPPDVVRQWLRGTTERPSRRR